MKWPASVAVADHSSLIDIPFPYLLSLVFLNLTLALLLRLAAPVEPFLSNQSDYQYVGEHGLAPNCPKQTYCYRVLIPALVEHIPLALPIRWRVYQVVANTAAGVLIAVATVISLRQASAAIVASVMVQTSFGFAYTAYDPYTADPAVFLASSIILLSWLVNRPRAAGIVTVICVFVKESVAFIGAAPAIASLIWPRRDQWRLWTLQAVIAWTILLTFHLLMDHLFGWSLGTDPSYVYLVQGAQLRLWLSEQGPSLAAFYIFAPFGFAWLYALLGYCSAPKELRSLGLGSVLPFLILIYLQQPERALENGAFVIVPLAVAFLSRLPLSISLIAALTNGLFTAKVGSSTAWLPSAALLLAIAAIPAIYAVVAHYRDLAMGPRSRV